MDTALLIAKSSDEGTFKNYCNTSCGGVEGAYGECCNMFGKNIVIGPVIDAQDVVQRLQKRFPEIKYEDVFMDFEEGKNLFPNKSYAQDPEHYPAYRLTKEERCIFYKDKNCSIQEEKSIICKRYACHYLIKTLDLPHPYPSGVPITEEGFRGVKSDEDLIVFF